MTIIVLSNFKFIVMDLRYIVYSIDVMGIPLTRYYENFEIEKALKKGIITPRLREPLLIWRSSPGYVYEFHYDAL